MSCGAKKTSCMYYAACVACSKLRVVHTEEQRSNVIKFGGLEPLDGRGNWGLTLTRYVPAEHHLNL
eukprot:5823241-Pyramimonas_sp.AAC.1